MVEVLLESGNPVDIGRAPLSRGSADLGDL